MNCFINSDLSRIEKIEKKGLGPIKEMLRSLGGWPVLEGDKWNDAAFTWKDSVYKFRNAGYSVDYFIDFSISTDLKNTTMRAIDVSISRATTLVNKLLWY